MIWCVEDDASIRDIELYALRAAGLEAEGFPDGDSFWRALQSRKPELVVLDVMLPGVDGVELLRRMRAAPATRSIPVVMATAKGAEYDKIQALDLGADYYLTKPLRGHGAGVLREGGAAPLRPAQPRAAPVRLEPGPGRPHRLLRRAAGAPDL